MIKVEMQVEPLHEAPLVGRPISSGEKLLSGTLSPSIREEFASTESSSQGSSIGSCDEVEEKVVCEELPRHIRGENSFKEETNDTSASNNELPAVHQTQKKTEIHPFNDYPLPPLPIVCPRNFKGGRANTSLSLAGLVSAKEGEESKLSEEASWLLGGKLGEKGALLAFRCVALVERQPSLPALTLGMTYKTIQAETKLLSAILNAHGWREVHPNIPDFNLLWTGAHPKPHLLRALTPYQRVNHFPRSYELTRKDRLYKNIEKMQLLKGVRHFDFIPQTFVMPGDFRELCSAHHRVRAPWIVKPVASSRGRGIFIVNCPNQVPMEECVVARYIEDPLLVGGHKCDLRLYVLVTSVDPLIIYMYEEGLVRFATVKYDSSRAHLWNPCMHLCNYSINKYHSDYIKSEDPSAEDFGHKWTLSALLRHLRANGIGDTAVLMQRIEEVVVKAILASVPPMVAATRIFAPHPHNCFELFGFDILIDSSLKPWLLEVNLSPSLGCDSPLDVRVKSAMLTDLLTLVGIPAVDPMARRSGGSADSGPSHNTLPKRTTSLDGPNSATSSSPKDKHVTRVKKLSCRRAQSSDSLQRKNVHSAGSRLSASSSSLSSEELRMVRDARAEFERRGGFVRVFPSADSWHRYRSYLDPHTGITLTAPSVPPSLFPYTGNKTNLNLLMHQQLFPNMDEEPASRKKGSSAKDPGTSRMKRVLNRYERALLVGCSANLSVDFIEKSDGGEGDADEVLELNVLKEEIRKGLESGSKLSQYQARRAFGLYLACILRRLLGSEKNRTTEESHGELVLRFLRRASCNLRTPYFVKIPSRKLTGKDRVAVIAKQLNDFIYLYNRETELYSDSMERPGMIPCSLFLQFLAMANEHDLEEVLTLQTRLYKCAHIFLGRCGPPVGGLRSLGLLGSLPLPNDASARVTDCECIRRWGRQASASKDSAKHGTSSPAHAVSKPDSVTSPSKTCVHQRGISEVSSSRMAS
ncbi:tubulin polyglutamylase TTLL5 isoform X2 [Ischnura elegans]|uniref:tubulin polyglutamylase TTLL5 isoform X2 n=1 Tax=Ischnura elegans TaxID=197161 RepID=UPI001ED875E6|nr:tubulin polyglutamylase TTLL5 isoform X2 [Ischnura elegans]